MQARFARLAARASRLAGSPAFFVGVQIAKLLWLIVGFALGWTDSVHLWPTSILTWLTMDIVILVQNSQTRFEDIIQTKLNELVRAAPEADNRLIGLEEDPPRAASPSG